MIVRITSKGQVTIPLAIREKLGLLPNTEVEFDIVGNTARMRKLRGGIPGARRRERRKILEKLFDLFEGNDAREEIRRLKAEDVEC